MYWYVSIYSEECFWPQYMYPKLSPFNGYHWFPLGKFSHIGMEQLWCVTILYHNDLWLFGGFYGPLPSYALCLFFGGGVLPMLLHNHSQWKLTWRSYSFSLNFIFSFTYPWYMNDPLSINFGSINIMLSSPRHPNFPKAPFWGSQNFPA